MAPTRKATVVGKAAKPKEKAKTPIGKLQTTDKHAASKS